MFIRSDCQVGIMFRREHAPDALPNFARRAEALGFDELWVVEDCFYTSGIASAATALACTTSIRVGLGIMPAVVRNPVFAAMEIATLAGLYPGRLLPGFGHGVAGWMRQIGAFPKSQLRALEEVTLTVRGLLAGEKVTWQGQHVRLEGTRLVHPPAHVPPLSLGVIGPKSLTLSGRVADGTILSECASPAYVAWAKDRIAQGRRQGHREDAHRLTVFAYACTGTAASAREEMRPVVADAIASRRMDAKFAPMGILPMVRELEAIEDRAALERSIPDAWINQLTIAGAPDGWRAAVDGYAALDVDSVVLVPLPDREPGEVEAFARCLGTP